MNRFTVRSVLRATRLLPAARRIRHWLKLGISPALRRREREYRRQFEELKRCRGDALACRLNAGSGTQEKALFVSSGLVQAVGAEIGLLKGLELAGLRPVVLSPPDPWLVRYYKLAGVEDIVFWEDFLGRPETKMAEQVASGLSSLPELLTFEHKSVRIGRFVASTALRRLRVGSLDFASHSIRVRLVPFLASAMAYASAACAVIGRVRPGLVLFVDRGYTPEGELFDICLANGIDVITWNAAHKNNALMIKRYTHENRDEHPASLSAESWAWVRQKKWTDAHRQRLQGELRSCYTSGEWYSEVGTQFNTRMLDTAEIRQRFGFQQGRKTAVIFPHILWDGTFFYGYDLFESYEAWFVETVLAACANTEVNWLIKVHPGNVIKNVRDGVEAEPAEVRAIRDCIGSLPDHVRMIPAESDVSTFSLFGLMDYCVTVRGTVGIEAASFGIPVLTAGTGRYDGRGFTIDSETRDEYLERIRGIHRIAPLSPEQREMAERFAYAIFVLRPLVLTTVTLEYERDARATPKARIHAVTREDWFKAPDLTAFAEWVGKAKELDFLSPDPLGHL